MCSYSENPLVSMLVKFVLLTNFSTGLTFFCEGENRSSSRVHYDVINVPKDIMQYIFWKPRMSPRMIISLFVNITIFIFLPNSTDLRFWITVHSDPGHGIRRKHENCNIDKKTYNHCWGHPGLSENVYHQVLRNIDDVTTHLWRWPIFALTKKCQTCRKFHQKQNLHKHAN